MRKIKLGLVGTGTVGGGVVRILQKHAQDFRHHQGVDIELSKVSTRTRAKAEALGLTDEQIVDSWEDIVNDPEIDIVVELVGGTGVAADIIITALKAGKYVVTANKAVMASRGAEVFAAADQGGVEVAFEGSVGGGIPIIQPLKHSLVGNEISSILGIVNGTTNYMLSRMNDCGLDYDTVLKEAQEKGYAEADPTADVDGLDAAAKIAILASIAFNSRVTIDDVPTWGIRSITPVDFTYAASMGYVIKLLAIAHKIDEHIDVRVHPTMLPKSHPLASVDGVYNAIFVTGDAVGDVMFFGQGAGSGAAASAVMGDIIETARRITYNVPSVDGCTCTENLPLFKIGDISCKYYIRIVVKDQPGVLAAISDVFGKENVSIRSMVQPYSEGENAELIFMTHHAKESDVTEALDGIKKLDSVIEIGTLVRVEEED